MAQQILLIPFFSQLIGQGFNTQTGEFVGTALEVDSVFEDTSADAQDANTVFEQASSQDSLLETLGVSASVDGRVGLFAGGAKMSFAEQHAVNSFSGYIAGRSFIQNAVRHGKGFRLNENAQALLKANRIDDFKKAFGDKFVRALFTGGEFCIVARITSISEEHQTKISAALHGEYNGFVNSVSFTAAFESATKETSGHTEVTVKMRQIGGQGKDLSFTGPNALEIIQRLKDLPEFVHQHAGGLMVEVASYDTIPIPIPTEEEIKDRELVLRDCAQQKNKFLQIISDIELSLEDNGRKLFNNLPSKSDLITVQSQYRNALSDLISHAKKVATGQIEPILFVANPPLPLVQFEKLPFTGKISVPFLTGLNVDKAIQVLELAGLKGKDNFSIVPDSDLNTHIVLSVVPEESTVVDFGTEVSLQTKIHKGEVFSGDPGHPRHGGANP